LSNNYRSLEFNEILRFLVSSSDAYLLLLGGLSLGDDLVEGGGVVVNITEGAEVADIVGGCRATGKTGPVEGLIVDHLSGAHTAGDSTVVLI
jgi:hypothetical protein